MRMERTWMDQKFQFGDLGAIINILDIIRLLLRKI